MTERYVPDMSVIHHSHMLKDKIRLEKYQKAISETVSPEDSVVDIGCGCGILSLLSSRKTHNQVHGIEYFDYPFALASAFCQEQDNITLHKNSSFQTTLAENIKVIVTETIGQIGPEEHMIEAVWDFCRRHPSVEKIVPSTLSVFVQPLYSPWFEAFRKEKKSSYDELSHYDMNSTKAGSIIDEHLGKLIFQSDLSFQQIVATGSSESLVKYELGITASSSFSQLVHLPEGGLHDANALHLYFASELSPGNILDTHYASPLTHWEHSFVLIPPGKRTALIDYRAGDRFLSCQWK
ncbi:50S ribosomal protein L11 methyltransferase [Photorhabdus bodei]|uniref:Methyltransferase domain-containing protein n=1 Tax=Photorhabdus bodei TaxID=2029681 RepID=A0A329X9R5_9GAMM|nr:50S ribosomal protein L11 methyltransferase [Photorhabdus bodei]NDL00810.1 hypothetical protein [Photorhabdus bodei]NDL04976.1 hypothetical protein [Photorhabdus bodei]NDL09309.1 hypothetical protein [Photorhabdus bodei]RAX13577.1 hypothetical protein CKY02_05520 [Photorhabdus bodei]